MDYRRPSSGAVAIAAATVLTFAATSGGVARADATPSFNGSYTVTKQSAPADPMTGAALSDRPSTWIVFSPCTLLGCSADVVSDSFTSFHMLFDGTSWKQLPTGDTATCRGASVPTSSSAISIVPRGNGSLTGTRTVALPCDGASVTLSQSLTVTPQRP